MKTDILYNTEKAFILKSYKELSKTRFLYRVMNNAWLSGILTRLLDFSLRIGLPVKSLVKKTIFKQFCGGETITESKAIVNDLYKIKVKSILDYSVEAGKTNENFDQSVNEILKIIHIAHNNPSIPYTCIKLTGFVRGDLLEKISSKAELSKTEEVDWELFRNRMITLFDAGKKYNVPIFIDAEESWIQPAIDSIAEEFMLKYNRDAHVVLTTLQMYRHDRIDYLNKLISLSRQQKIKLGIKLVRGAYLEKENERARKFNYPSPINPTKEDTDLVFDEAVKICLDNVDLIMLCAGTHNEASTLLLLDEMKKRNLPNNHPNIFFSQLYGMSDNITMNLGAADYNVTKYVPYGPVEAVIPYLVRRAQENSGISGQMSRELKMILQETERRKKLKLLN